MQFKKNMVPTRKQTKCYLDRPESTIRPTNYVHGKNISTFRWDQEQFVNLSANKKEKTTNQRENRFPYPSKSRNTSSANQISINRVSSSSSKSRDENVKTIENISQHSNVVPTINVRSITPNDQPQSPLNGIKIQGVGNASDKSDSEDPSNFSENQDYASGSCARASISLPSLIRSRKVKNSSEIYIKFEKDLWNNNSDMFSTSHTYHRLKSRKQGKKRKVDSIPQISQVVSGSNISIERWSKTNDPIVLHEYSGLDANHPSSTLSITTDRELLNFQESGSLPNYNHVTDKQLLENLNANKTEPQIRSETKKETSIVTNEKADVFGAIDDTLNNNNASLVNEGKSFENCNVPDVKWSKTNVDNNGHFDSFKANPVGSNTDQLLDSSDSVNTEALNYFDFETQQSLSSIYSCDLISNDKNSNLNMEDIIDLESMFDNYNSYMTF